MNESFGRSSGGSDMPSVRPKDRTRKKQSEEPVGEPLERRSLRFFDRDGNIRQCGALDKRFAHPMVFVKYTAPPAKENAAGELSKWFKNVDQFESNLKILLRLPHHRFWSTVVHEPCLHIALESYLAGSPRFYYLHSGLTNDQMKLVVNSIHGLVFKVFLRMGTICESKKDYMNSNHFGNLVYSKFLFDVPKLIDICTVYGNCNDQVRELLRQMIENVLNSNSKYFDDLSSALNGFSTFFENVKEICEDSIGSGSPFGRYSWSSLLNLVNTVTDVSVAVANFIAISPLVAKRCHQENFEPVIANFYEVVFVPLQAELESRFSSSPEAQLISCTVKGQVVIARSMLIKSFRDLLVSSVIDPLFDESGDYHAKHLLCDNLFDVLSGALSEKHFAKDYRERYPLETDIRLLKENANITGFNNVDQTRIDYLLHTTTDEIDEPIATAAPPTTIQNNLKSVAANLVTNGSQRPKNTNENEHRPKVENIDHFPELPSNVTSTAGGGMGEIQLLSLISSIKDLLPDLGDGFVEACLADFQFDVERTIDALCTDNLSPTVQCLCRTMSRAEYAATLLKPMLPSVIAERSNIYDGDEFDIYRRTDVDVSKIHIGKKVVKDSVVQSVDSEMKERIKRLDQMKLEEEADEEERLYFEECQRALDDKDQAERDLKKTEDQKLFEEEKARKEQKQQQIGEDEPRSNSNRGRGRGRGSGGAPRTNRPRPQMQSRVNQRR